MEKEQNKKTARISTGRMIFAVVLCLIVGGLLLAPSPDYRVGLQTIDEARSDAQQKDENAPPESKDFRKPTWAQYQKQSNPSFFGQKLSNLLSLLGLKKRPAWSPSYFKNIIEKLTAQQAKKGYRENFAVRIVPHDKSRFIVFGDLIGAYHSLIRRLEKLISLKILDTNLKLTSPDDHIIFMGDVVNRSPFIMETLSLLATLLDKNPGQVTYIKGSDEWKGYWHPYGMQEEFAFKARHVASPDKLTQIVDDFFETLPLGLYVSVFPHTGNDFIRFSHYAISIPASGKYAQRLPLLDHRYFSEDLLAQRKIGKEKIITLKQWRGDLDAKQVAVRAIIKSIKKSKDYQPSKGLLLLDQDTGATAWNFKDSPVLIVQEMVQNYDESFGIIQSTEQLNDWTITLYYRDIRKKDDFKPISYNFISGKENTV